MKICGLLIVIWIAIVLPCLLQIVTSTSEEDIKGLKVKSLSLTENAIITNEPLIPVPIPVGHHREKRFIKKLLIKKALIAKLAALGILPGLLSKIPKKGGYGYGPRPSGPPPSYGPPPTPAPSYGTPPSSSYGPPPASGYGRRR